MNNPTITDVFFDLDHTLWDFDKNSLLAFARIFDTYQIDIDIASFIEVYEPINFNYWKLFREDRVSKQELRHGRLIDTFKLLNRSFSSEVIENLSVAYIDELPKDNHLFEGAIPILEYLFEKYKLHIITNGFREVQNLKLENSGISHFFETVTSSEEVGVKKPNPLIFHAALGKGGVTPINSIMIGDTFEADILGAEEVGMDTIFYNYRNDSIPTTYKIIDHLAEIKMHL